MSTPVLDHYAGVLGAPTAVLEADDDLTIAALAPTRGVMVEPTTRLLLTDGMSRQPMKVPDRIPARVELLAAVPAAFEQAYACEIATSWLVDMLRTLAAYPARTGTWLGAGHTLPIGRALAPQTDMAGLLLSVPLVLEYERLWSFGDEPIHLLLATPLHPAELSLARTQGTGALMNRLFALVETVGQDWGFFTLPKRPDTVLGPAIFA